MRECREALMYSWAFAAGYQLACYQHTDSTGDLLAALLWVFMWALFLLVPIIQETINR